MPSWGSRWSSVVRDGPPSGRRDRPGRLPWVSAGLVAALAAASLLPPGGSEILQYDRSRVAGGELWRLITGQAIHWTPRMTLVDLAALLGLGAWLEWRGARRALLAALVLAAGLSALAVHLFSPDLQLYRGSSGLSSALFVLTALCLAGSSSGARRALAVAALALFVGKAGWEALASTPLFAGPLPPGIRVVPLVHLLGGLGGLLAWLADPRTAQPGRSET